MYTDPKRVRADIPGTVEGNPVFMYHDAFNPNTAEVDDLKERYRAGKVGDVEVKTKLAAALNAHLEPIRERRAAVVAQPDRLKEILVRGLPARARRRRRDDGAGAGRDEDRRTKLSPMDAVRTTSNRRSTPCRSTSSSFEGPLDLLLHLIKKNEVNIYDIPIALITSQYLDDDRADAGPQSRRRRRVPGDGGDADSHQVEDAAAAARDGGGRRGRGRRPARRARRAGCSSIEKFKAAAGLLHEREQVRAAQWRRPDERVAALAGDEYEPELEVDLFSLLTAFQAVVERAKQRPKVLLPPEQMPVEVRIEQLLERLSETEACGFEDLFADVHERSGLIVTFLALLEMIRLKLVRVFQSGSFGPIRVYKRARPADAPHPIGDPETHRG